MNLNAVALLVGTLLKENQQTIAVCESSCGGLISAALVGIQGASAYFVGGAVVYTRASQKEMLQVPDDVLLDLKASSEPYALLNARVIRNLHGTTWGLSETGASGPTGNRYGDSAGHVCIAVSGPMERAVTLETGNSDREANMMIFRNASLELLMECIIESRSER